MQLKATNELKVHVTSKYFFFRLKKCSCFGEYLIEKKIGFGRILNFFLWPVEVEFRMDHDRVNGDLGRVELWRHFEKTLKQFSQSSICESLSSTKIHCLGSRSDVTVVIRPLNFETRSRAQMAAILVRFSVL